MTHTSTNPFRRLIGMIRSPRATLASAIAAPRSFDLAIVVVAISTACSAGFLMTRVGRLAALDQQVRQLESLGTVVDDEMYEQLRALVPYRPAISAMVIIVGWPLSWLAGAAVVRTIGDRVARHLQKPPTFNQVLTVFVHASAVLAVREMVALPINLSRESLGGATSAAMLLPGFADVTFPARLLGAIDLAALWWVVVMAMGLGMLYEVRARLVARWLLGAYALGAVALAVTQTLRGGA